VTDFDPLDSFRGDIGEPDIDRRDRIRADFRARVASLPPDRQGRRPFDPPRPPAPSRSPLASRRPALVLAALVLTLGVIGGTSVWLRGDHTSTAPVEQLAATAASQPDTALDHGQYLHRSEQLGDQTSGPVVRERWTAPDGTGQEAVSAMSVAPPGSSVPSLTVFTVPGSLQFAGLTYDELRSLPTEPDELLRALRRLGAVRADDEAASAAALTDVLALDVTPPDVAATALHALSLVGGSVTGSMTDGTGRTGVAIEGTNADGSRWIALIDPATGRSIGFYPAAPPGPGPASATPYHYWIDQDIVDSLPPGN
jgi:hypothetical protein